MMRMAISLRLRASSFGTFPECCTPRSRPLWPESWRVDRADLIPNDFRHEQVPGFVRGNPAPDFARRDVVESSVHLEIFDAPPVREVRGIRSRSGGHEQTKVANQSLE